MGNTRVSFKDSSGHLVKTAETAFDPWGLKLTGVGSVNEFQNRWELQGHESEQTFGLNRVNFGARVYNPTIGRWDRVDNFSELMPNLSGYRYSFNNPVNVTDPDGNFEDFEYSDGYSMNSTANGSVSITSFSGTYSTGKQEGCPPNCGAFEKLFSNPTSKEDAAKYARMREDDFAFGKYMEAVEAKFREFFSWIPFGSTAVGVMDAQKGDYGSAAEGAAMGLLEAGGGGIIKVGGKVLSKVGSSVLLDLGVKDGMKITSSKALQLGEQFLGKGYKELVSGSGRYVSADGTRVFRMGLSDITGRHGGGPHVNFETLIPNPAKPGKMMVDKNYHVYLID